jgi:hypothetical protein
MIAQQEQGIELSSLANFRASDHANAKNEVGMRQAQNRTCSALEDVFKFYIYASK